jgi:hypothetical protein
MELNRRYESDTAFHNEFMERLAILAGAVSKAPAPIRPMLSSIHRSALSFHNMLQSIDITPLLPSTPFSKLSCFDCGTTTMESFHTSKQGGYHLCPTCFQHRIRTGRARTAH